MNDFTILKDSWEAFVEEAIDTRAQWEATWALRGVEAQAVGIGYDERFDALYDVFRAGAKAALEESAPQWLTDPSTWGDVAADRTGLLELIG